MFWLLLRVLIDFFLGKAKLEYNYVVSLGVSAIFFKIIFNIIYIFLRISVDIIKKVFFQNLITNLPINF